MRIQLLPGSQLQLRPGTQVMRAAAATTRPAITGNHVIKTLDGKSIVIRAAPRPPVVLPASATSGGSSNSSPSGSIQVSDSRAASLSHVFLTSSSRHAR